MENKISDHKPDDMSDQLKEQLEQAARNTDPSHLDEVANQEQEIRTKFDKVPPQFKKLIKQAGLLLELILSYRSGEYRHLPWKSMAYAVTALLYFLWIIDLIPDFIPISGFLDDAALVAFVVKSLQEDLKKYCDFKGYDRKEYF